MGRDLQVEDAAAGSTADASPLGIRFPTRADRRAFLLVAGGATLVVLIVMVIVSLAMNDGHLAYALDDAGIHLSIVRQLTEHGTWGIQSGVYAAASSSPGWTLLLSAFTWPLPMLGSLLPLLLNAVAGGWLIYLFASNQTFIRPSRHDWASVALAVYLPIVVLFIPSFCLLGMEHLLHAALVIQALVLLRRLEDGPLTLHRARWLVLVLFLGTLVRFESLWIAGACALVIVLRAVPRLGRSSHGLWTLREALPVAAVSFVAGCVPVVVYGVVSKLNGEAFLPNSIAAKAAIGERGFFQSPAKDLEHIQGISVLLILLLVVVAYVVAAWWDGPRGNFSASAVFVIAVLAHANFGDFGFYTRYEGYLIAMGSFVVLLIAGEVVRPEWATAARVMLLLALVATTTIRVGLVVDTPTATSNTYRQRYQLGRFFHDEYDNQPVATGELGYASFFHNGPFTDLLGIGTSEVTRALEANGGHLPAPYLEELARRNGTRAIAVYDFQPSLSIPPSWIAEGAWELTGKNVSGLTKSLLFFAPNKRLGARLDRKLKEFAPRLPSGVQYLDRKQLVKRFVENLKER